ncbi:MAG: hypothetical protein AAB336_07095 [Acidobacteriota bacterium]
MARRVLIGLLFTLLVFFGTTSECFAQKNTKKSQLPPSRNNDWFTTFAKATDFTEENPNVLVVLINRAKNNKDVTLAKLEKNVATALNELKLGVSFKIFSGSSDTANTYYGLLNANDSGDNSFDSIDDDFKNKAKELAEKIKATILLN